MCKRLFQPTVPPTRPASELKAALKKHEQQVRNAKSQKRFNDNLTYEQRGKLWAKQRYVNNAEAPLPSEIHLLMSAEAQHPDNSIVQAISLWYRKYNCFKESQLTYLKKITTIATHE